MEIDERLIKQLIEENTSVLHSIKASMSANNAYQLYNDLTKQYLDMKYRVLNDKSISDEEKLEMLDILADNCRMLISSPATQFSGRDARKYFKLFQNLCFKVCDLQKEFTNKHINPEI